MSHSSIIAHRIVDYSIVLLWFLLQQLCLQPGALRADDQDPLAGDVHVVRRLAHHVRGVPVGVEVDPLLVLLLQIDHVPLTALIVIYS